MARPTRSRRNSHFTAKDWRLVERMLGEFLSPEQISGRLRLEGLLEISHETIYKYVWMDKRCCGELYLNLRQPFKRWCALRNHQRNLMFGRRPG